jgi:7-carboxy-7-deazaguanine synthase
MTPTDHIYAIAPNGVFWTIQGEGHLRGFQMLFLRLAGCSVGCKGCDTNYTVAEKLSIQEILARLAQARPKGDRDGWVWITGGEPADRDCRPLLTALKSEGYSTAVASSGVKRFIPPTDWLSISPHSVDPARFQQRYGNEVKLAEALNGLELDEWYESFPDEETDFMYRYVQPLWVGDAQTGYESPESLERCKAFLKKHPRWALSRQDHKHWGVW